MNSIKWLVIIAGIAVIHTEIHYEHGVSQVFDFFPFNKEAAMSLRGYVWRIGIRVTMLCYFWREYLRAKPEHQQYMIWTVILQALIVVEFLLTYNKPWFVISTYPHIEIGLSHVLLIFICSIYGKLLWHHQNQQE